MTVREEREAPPLPDTPSCHPEWRAQPVTEPRRGATARWQDLTRELCGAKCGGAILLRDQLRVHL